ncbi:hypothetical protein CFC21_090712 [Triticum aestivum]|uniref:Leucine-rich repeat-containing N-terminal plant-type domain-containing protein n=2 Tax=Triticum aestivum TaxID=4565 RepID=A0A3B6Q8H5_WHEAT|nr:hypothetical protein CFC21_090712 [Triticum aestivum]
MADPTQLVRFVTILAMCFLLFHRSSSALPPTTAGTLCIPRERDALLDFKAGLTDPGNLMSSWRGVECCRWTGVVCSNRTGHVVALQISSESMDKLGGEIRSSLLTLRHMKQLDLSGNDFGGQPIPELIGTLGRLTHLDLSYSNFSGRIPPHLGNLSNLVSLRLKYMAHGSYSPDLAWVSRLRKLQVLWITYVDLSAVADWFHAINMLPYLIDLDLTSCGLQNIVPPPVHSNLTSLESLTLDLNPFNTSLGAKNWVWNLPSLQGLSLSSCGIHGPIPDAVGNLTSIQTLDLGFNMFTGIVPSTIKKQKKLQNLLLHYNFINMDVAELLHRLPSNELYVLFLEENHLTGSLPDQLGHFSNLTIIALDNNKLSGEIPVGIRELINLSDISLTSNNLHGTITEDHFTNLTNLQFLYISDNSLTVKVDSTWKAPFSLVQADFRSCILGPQFPSWLNQPHMIDLDVSNTSIHDNIPVWIANSSAQYLNLSRNRLAGMLPTFSLSSPLRILDVSSNQIVGRFQHFQTT